MACGAVRESEHARRAPLIKDDDKVEGDQRKGADDDVVVVTAKVCNADLPRAEGDQAVACGTEGTRTQEGMRACRQRLTEKT